MRKYKPGEISVFIYIFVLALLFAVQVHSHSVIELKDKIVMSIDGEVTDKKVIKLYRQIKTMDHSKPLEIMLRSPGGAVDLAIDFMYYLDRQFSHITTIAYSARSTAGIWWFIGNSRKVVDNGHVMMHNCSMESWFYSRKCTKAERRKGVRLVMKYTGWSEEKVEYMFYRPGNHYFKRSDLKRLGLLR